ncbi:MAG: PEP/pyruvate-binding domain-containing protein [Microthrixaceae bacterium]
MSTEGPDVVWLEEVDSGDVASVGGKNASLGEMIGSLAERGIRVPGGFATTARAYRRHLADNDLVEQITERLQSIRDGADPAEQARGIRELVLGADLPSETEEAIRDAYAELARRLGRTDPDVAVRSSATAEDLPEASFAGQQDTYLNISGIDALLDATRRCYASLFTDRAINYREHHHFEHMDVALSVCIQQMVRSDGAGAGVMFTLDTDSGFPEVVLVDAAWGLGESVVSGQVDPDEHIVYKPTLHTEGLDPLLNSKLGAKRTKIVYGEDPEHPTVTVDTTEEERDSFVLSHDEVVGLARWASVIEDHYGRPMDIEWAKGANSGEMYIVQARPETVRPTRMSPASGRSSSPTAEPRWWRASR